MTIRSQGLEERIQELQHLLGSEDQLPEFREPTLLKDVPSFSSHEIIYDPSGGDDAELERRIRRNPA